MDVSLSKLDQGLIAAYLKTNYHVIDLGIDIRISNRHTALDVFLYAKQLDEWSFITAWNPGSKLQSKNINQQQQQLLEKWVLQNQYLYFQGLGIGQDDQWEAEESFLILGISKLQSILLAQKFDQNAFVYGRHGKKAELVLLK